MIDDRFLALCAKYKPSYADFRHIISRSERIGTENREISISSIFGSGIGLRIFNKNRWVNASSNDSNNLDRLFERCMAMVGTVRSGKAKLPCAVYGKARFKARCRINPFDVPYDDKKELLLDFKNSMDAKEIVSTNSVMLSTKVSEHFMNSNGADIKQESTRVFFGSTSVARSGANIQPVSFRAANLSGYESIKKLDVETVTSELKAKAVRLLNAEPAPSGSFTLICDPVLAGLFFHEALGHACEADFILDGSSILRKRLNKKIASDIVSVSDEPTRQAWGFYMYDDEGVKTGKTRLIENGALKGFLHSIETASEMAAKPTGNGRSDLIENTPIPRMSNLVIEKGDFSVNELLNIKNGILATGFKGGQVDITKGNFIFACEEAFIIEHGEKKRSLRDVAFSGNILDVLKNIDAMGNKQFMTVPGGTCGKKGQYVPVGEICPHIRVKKVIVGGAAR